MRLKTQISLKIATILRIVGLSVTIMSLLAGYFWMYQQEVVNSIDEKLSKSYFGQYEMQLDSVNDLYKAKKYNATAVQAEIFLSAMKHIRTRDKSYPVKRTLLLRLILSRIHLGTTHVTEALPYAKSWAKSDERDITAWRAYIQVLEKIPDKDDELQDALNSFHYRFPGESTSHRRMN